MALPCGLMPVVVHAVWMHGRQRINMAVFVFIPGLLRGVVQGRQLPPVNKD